MYNRVIMIGRLVQDPEMRTTPNGINVARIRIAVDRPYQKGAERKSDFFNVTCWRQQAEFVCRYFSKGRLLGVEGSVQNREYTDKDGNRRFATDIIADRVFFVESKSAANSGSNDGGYSDNSTYRAAPAADAGVSYSSGSVGDFSMNGDDDDLPF